MNRSLLVAALLAIALTACNKKEEASTTLPAPATPPTLPTATLNAPAEPAKPADGAPLTTLPEEKPTGEVKPAN